MNVLKNQERVIPLMDNDAIDTDVIKETLAQSQCLELDLAGRHFFDRPDQQGLRNG